MPEVIAKGVYKIGDDVFIWDDDFGISLRFWKDVIWGETVGMGRDNRAWGTPFIDPDN